MTTHEKARMIEYINYCAALGDSNRRASRKWDIQYIAGWLAGSAHSRHEVAKEMEQFIEVSEILEGEWLSEKNTEFVPTASTITPVNHGVSARSKQQRRKGAFFTRRFGTALHTISGKRRRHHAPTQKIIQPIKGGD